jgi:hypothetical protein
MSMRAAINAKCKDCIYDPCSGLGTWRQQVEGCSIRSCSLWTYRPKSRSNRLNGPDLASPQTDQAIPA